jgi:formate dehydrogenase subunit gamma
MKPQGTPGAVDDAVAILVERLKHLDGALLPILHAVQEAHGCITDEAVRVIASGLNLSRAEVHGVVGFYHDFRRTPSGRHVVRVCRAESCQAMQGDALAEHAKARLGVDWHETSADGRFTLEPVYCLGNCACSPAVMIDDALHGRMDERRFDAAVAALEGGR